MPEDLYEPDYKKLWAKYNRGESQLRELYEFCDNDYDKLIKLLDKLWGHFYHPATKEKVNQILNS
jgi:hypothetical protein